MRAERRIPPWSKVAETEVPCLTLSVAENQFWCQPSGRSTESPRPPEEISVW